MIVNNNLKLSDDALDQVVGGSGNVNEGGKVLYQKMIKCPNKGCKSHTPDSPGYDNDLALFDFYSGGRAQCTVCKNWFNT